LLNETFVSDCRQIPDIYISQGSVASRFRCGGIFNDSFITRLLMSSTVKEFWKSVNICRSYGQLSTGLIFMKHGVEWPEKGRCTHCLYATSLLCTFASSGRWSDWRCLPPTRLARSMMRFRPRCGLCFEPSNKWAQFTVQKNHRRCEVRSLSQCGLS